MSPTGDGDKYAPWYGPWYAFECTPFECVPNEPVEWDYIGFNIFELHSDRAVIRSENCLWGVREWTYNWYESDDGRLVLDPVSGAHEFPDSVSDLYVDVGEDCSSLYVWAVGDSEEPYDPFNAPLQRGELCLEHCRDESENVYDSLVSDCGIPVPWEC